MPSCSRRWNWQVEADSGVTTNEVAARLASLEGQTDLRYRDVVMQARTVDRVPQRENGDDSFYRLYVLQALAWPPLRLPQHHRLPGEWSSEAVTLPRPPADAHARLAYFETEFAIRSFLHRVEREIDSVFRRSADHNHSWTRSGTRGAPLRSRPNTARCWRGR